MTILTDFGFYSVPWKQTDFEKNFNNIFLNPRTMNEMTPEQHKRLLALRKQIKRMEQSIHELKEIALVNSEREVEYSRNISSLEELLKKSSRIIALIFILNSPDNREDRLHTYNLTKNEISIRLQTLQAELDNQSVFSQVEHFVWMLLYILACSVLVYFLSVMLFQNIVLVAGGVVSCILLDLQATGLVFAIVAAGHLTQYLAENAYYDVRFFRGQQVKEIENFRTFLNEVVDEAHPSDINTPTGVSS